MCKFFSAIVLRDGSIRWHWNIDSHSDLLTHFGIADTSEARMFAKAELTPGADADWSDPETWTFRLDEEAAPVWWEDVAVRAAKEMRRIAAGFVIKTGRRALIADGVWILAGDAVVDRLIGGRVMRMSGSSQVGLMYGSAQVWSMSDSSRVGLMSGSTLVGLMSGSTRVGLMYNSSLVESMSDSARVESMSDSARVGSMSDSARVGLMSGSAGVGLMSGSSLVESMSGSARVGLMSGSAGVGLMSGSTRVGLMSDSARVVEDRRVKATA